MFSRMSKPLPRLALAGAAICLSIVLALVVSPSARAHVIEFVERIGGMNITQTTDYPGSDGAVNIAPSKELSLDEARQALPYPVRLPAWTPEGFVFHPEAATLTEFNPPDTPQLRVYWQKDYGEPHEVQAEDGLRNIQSAVLDLTIDYPASKFEDGSYIVGVDSAEEVQMNGQPAILVRGAWNADTQAWGASDLLFLHWEEEDVRFTLSVSEFSVSVEELIRVAESFE